MLICSSGFISSEDEITARKLEPLIIICDKLTKDIMPFNILFLNSLIVMSFYIFNIHFFLSISIPDLSEHRNDSFNEYSLVSLGNVIILSYVCFIK